MIKQLQLLNSLSPMDVVVAKKRNGLGRILNHYIVYLGNSEFIGNLEKGVSLLDNTKLEKLLADYEPVKIRKFQGNHLDTLKARTRALSKLGQKYSFLRFNCEHFANWVQYGKVSSSQVSNGFLVAAGFVILKLITSNNGER